MFYGKEGGGLGTHGALMKKIFSQFGWWDGNVESTAVKLTNRNSYPHQLMSWWTMCIY